MTKFLIELSSKNMQIRWKCKYKLREHDSKTEFMHEWLKNWRGTITSSWSGIGRKEEDICLSGLLLLPKKLPLWTNSSTKPRLKLLLCFSTFEPDGQESELVHPHKKAYLSQPHSLMALQRLDHPKTFWKVRCGRVDALLLVLLATLTHIKPCQPFSRSY